MSTLLLLPIPRALPNEIWREIMLCDSHAYCTSALVCRAFRVDLTVAKAAMVRKIETSRMIKYQLPNGRSHSINDQPSVIYASGNKYWHRDGLVHRDNDQPAAIHADGTKFWCRNGIQHRDNDQPAVMSIRERQWYRDGKQYRENGLSAIIYGDYS